MKRRGGFTPGSIQHLVAHYQRKTRAILERYGPGPRVHYHTGLADEPALPGSSVEGLRQSLVAAQERLLYHAAGIWDAASTLSGDVLDVGCGLGGGAIFWAQEFGAQVTAVTCVAVSCGFGGAVCCAGGSPVRRSSRCYAMRSKCRGKAALTPPWRWTVPVIWRAVPWLRTGRFPAYAPAGIFSSSIAFLDASGIRRAVQSTTGIRASARID